VNEKLVRRHPHVFGDGKLETSAQVLTQWDLIKADEKKASGTAAPTTFKELPPRLPALMYAESVWKQMGKKGLVAESGVDTECITRLAAELDGAKLGRMLFELAAAAQARDLDPEGALRQHADGLVRHVEGRLQKTTA
jgi:XTP/dITP diphosphohydrolase/tetrapyrrole methylase family protein/MazG family protein